MTTDYIPITCGRYDIYEIAILYGRCLQLTWNDGNIIYHRVMKPTDLQTCNHEEFLLVHDGDGASYRLRLDHISRATVI